ncbi:hypothetical protein FACS1894186_1240 [Alphaproteobacteria bacterium]|nr:hypothetical protein FACS1894186_1240 [Alphaproteobacteria bacterium]
MRILIADDNCIFASGLAIRLSAIRPAADIEFSHSISDAMAAAQSRSFDFVFVDPLAGGSDYRRTLPGLFSSCRDRSRVVVLSAAHDFADARFAFSCGKVSGCLAKRSPEDSVSGALSLLLSGAPYYPPSAPRPRNRIGALIAAHSLKLLRR